MPVEVSETPSNDLAGHRIVQKFFTQACSTIFSDRWRYHHFWITDFIFYQWDNALCYWGRIEIETFNLIWEIFKKRRLLCLFMHILLAVEHILTSVITSLESLLGIWNVITSEAKKSPIYILNHFTTFLSFFFFFPNCWDLLQC